MIKSGSHFFKEAYMKTQFYIGAHKQSYTYRFAENFVNKWELYHRQKLEIVDIAEPFMTARMGISIKQGQTQSFTFHEKTAKILYAFHPQMIKQKYPNRYIYQAMACAYGASLSSAGCVNPPITGSWGHHLSFLHARRLLISCGFDLTQLTESNSENQHLPGIRPLQTFLLSNITKRSPQTLKFSDLKDDWKERLIITHVVGDTVLSYRLDGESLPTPPTHERYFKLRDIIGSQVIEVVELEELKNSRTSMGIHPCLMYANKNTLNQIAIITGALS